MYLKILIVIVKYLQKNEGMTKRFEQKRVNLIQKNLPLIPENQLIKILNFPTTSLAIITRKN